MGTVNWLRQGFDFLEALRKARAVSSPPALPETCLRQLLICSGAEETIWLEKESLIALSITSPEQAVVHKFSFNHQDQCFLLSQKEIGCVDQALLSSARLPNYRLTHYFLPIAAKRVKGCYVVSYRDSPCGHSEFIEFLQVCRQALTDLHEAFQARNRYEKLKIRFNGILKSLPHGVIFLEDEGSYCWANENAAQLLGIPSGTIEPALVHAAMSALRNRARNVEEIKEMAQAAFNGEKTQRCNWIFDVPQFQALGVSLRRVRTASINGILWVWEDITRTYLHDQELLRLNKELAEKKDQAEEMNQRYRYVGQATFDAIWDWDLQKGTLFWGKNYESIFGYDRDPQINHIQNWKERIHPEDSDRVVNGLNRTIEGTENNWADEYRYRKADGSFVQVADKAFVIRNNEGKAIRAVGAMQDITAKKAAEIKIKESEFNLRAIFESSIESFVLLDSVSEVRAFNGRAEDYIWKVWGQELKIGDNMLNYMDPARGAKFGTYLDRVRSGEIIEYDRSYQRPGEPIYWSHFTLTPVYHGSAVIGTCITERNVTDLKNHLDTIENQNQTFREISWTQSHLVRAPLTNIMAITDLLKNHILEEDRNTLLDHLQTATQKLDAVIQKITSLTSCDENNGPLAKTSEKNVA